MRSLLYPVIKAEAKVAQSQSLENSFFCRNLFCKTRTSAGLGEFDEHFSAPRKIIDLRVRRRAPPRNPLRKVMKLASAAPVEPLVRRRSVDRQ